MTSSPSASHVPARRSQPEGGEGEISDVSDEGAPEAGDNSPAGVLPPELLHQLLDRCEVSHLSEVYERWIDARQGLVAVAELHSFNRAFSLNRVRADIGRHPTLVLAHPPRPVATTVPGGDIWYVVDARGLQQWLPRIFDAACGALWRQSRWREPPMITVNTIADCLGVNSAGDDGAQVAKLDHLLELVTTKPGIFLRRHGPVAGIDIISYELLSRFHVPIKRRLLYELILVVAAFLVILTLIIPLLRGL